KKMFGRCGPRSDVDHRRWTLLAAYRDRPRRHTPKSRDELPPPHPSSPALQKTLRQGQRCGPDCDTLSIKRLRELLPKADAACPIPSAAAREIPRLSAKVLRFDASAGNHGAMRDAWFSCTQGFDAAMVGAG